MLEILIKRDGTEEPVIPSKLNGWNEWAARHLQNRVEYSAAALAAVAKLPKKATTTELSEAVIGELLDMRTYPAYMMAGTLYAVNYRKDIYGSLSCPTVWEQHARLQAVGLMREMDYTRQEYALIESFIDHEKDFHYPEYSIKFIRDKYAIKNAITGQVYETPQFLYMRMAMACAEKRPAHERLHFVEKFYKAFSDKKLSAPTPNYLYLGTHHYGWASCCIYTTGDDEESLAIGNYIAWKMTVNSAGLGDYMSTRTVGDPIAGGRIMHGGKYKYYNAKSSSTIANKQAARGGAGTSSFCGFDPEAPDIVQYRNPMTSTDKQNRDLHFCMLSNAWFAMKVANNEDIFTFTAFSAPDLMDAFFSPDLKKFVELYQKYEADENFPKKYISARKLVMTSFGEAFDTGTAYLSFVDEMNRHTPFKITVDHRIHCSNLCVAPETLILTDKGYVEIHTVADTKVNVWNGEEWSEVDVVKTGTNQKLVHVETDSGYSLDCTPYHKFYIVDSYGAEPREVRAHELKNGDKLIKFNFPVIEGTKEYNCAYQQGFFAGDGCITPQGQRIYLYGEKMGLQAMFPEIEDWTHQPKSNRAYGHMRNLGTKYWVPDASYTVAARLTWLAGYLDADGAVCCNGENQSIQVKSIEFDFLKKVQFMLNTLGVSAKLKQVEEERLCWMPANDGTGGKNEYHAQAAWRLLINSVDAQNLLKLGLCTRRLKIEKHEPQRSASRFVTVVGVSDFGRTDDTYCFTEHKRHMGVFDGLLTGQCQEIMEIQKAYYNMMDLYSEEDHGRGEIAMCNLAAIPVENIVSDEEYFEMCYLALSMIDYTILNSKYPFPHLAFTAKKRMNAGVGIMGLATLMASKGLKWDSIEGKKEIHRVFERHMYMLIKASLKISKERGLAPWIHKTKWPEGWTPMSTYNRSVDTIADFEYLFDWQALSAEIKANGGIAHSVLCAMMPGESSSKALGSTNSVYPIRSNVIVKTDGDNNIIRWAAVDGDLLGDAYQSVWDINTIDMIHCYAIMQKWCDQGISADLYRRFAPGETKVTEKEVVETYLAMVHYGMKSRYYTNTLRPKVRKMDAVKNLVRNSDSPLSDGSAGVPKTPEKTVATSPVYDGVHEGYSRMDTPAVILDLDLLGDITGVAALPDVAARQQVVQDEYAENAKEHCTTHCAL